MRIIGAARDMLFIEKAVTEVYEMDRNDLPLGFGFALAQDAEAMKAFSALSEEKQRELLRRAHGAASEGEMQSLVRELSSRG